MPAPDTLTQTAQDGAGPRGRSEGGHPFSPGPWRAAGIFVVTSVPTKRDPDVREVLIVADCGYERFTPRDQHEANARLIAAAPDLLSACQAALELMDASAAEDDDVAWHEVIRMLREAIERASHENDLRAVRVLGAA